jgi:membrane protein required for beta-lactamase induction
MARAGALADQAEAQRLRAAMRLVFRTLFIWLTAISMMTLFGWLL